MQSASAQNQKLNPFKVELLKSDRDIKVNGYKIYTNLSLTMSKNDYNGTEIRLTEMPILLKVKISDKLSLLGGAKLDFSRGSNGELEDLGVSTSLGLQYDFSESSYIQGGFDYQIKSTNNIYHYNFGNPSSFYFSSGFKF
jgi:hypothetical protein